VEVGKAEAEGGVLDTSILQARASRGKANVVVMDLFVAAVEAVVEAKVVTLQAPEVEREEEAFPFPSLATTYSIAQVVPLHALRE